MKTKFQYETFNYKIAYTILIAVVYLIGRNIPLYGVDTAAYTASRAAMGNSLLQAIGGDANQYSIFALGVSPYILAGIVVQIVMSIRGSEARRQMSPRQNAKWTLRLLVLFAFLQAFMKVQKLILLEQVGIMLLLTMAIDILQMVAGAVIILWFSERCRKYGIGGQSVLILVNIADGLIRILTTYRVVQLAGPLLISLVTMVIILFMEDTELRIQIQRIGVHSAYADKNYIAVKMNPIGVMPVMFASSFFMVPQFIGSVLRMLSASNGVAFFADNMDLQHPLGITVYCIILFALAIAFPLVFLNPTDMTEQLLKNGDSILGVRSGRETKQCLRDCVLQMSLISAVVMTVCVAVPLGLQFYGMEEQLVMLPTTLMLLAGIFKSLYEEAGVIMKCDSYRAFL